MSRRVVCPNCGFGHYIEEKQHTFENRVRSPFKNAGSIAIPSPLPAVRETPAYLPTQESHVRVPFDQACITGFFAGPVGGVIAYGLASLVDAAVKDLEFTGWGMLVFGLSGAILTGFTVAGQDWLRQRARYDNLLWAIEELTGVDWSGDNEIGEPEPPTVKVEMVQANGVPRVFAELPIDLPRLRELARLVIVAKAGFSQPTASEAGISRDEFNGLRDEMIERGWARWNHPTERRQGVSLTREGVNILRTILSTPLPGGSIPLNSVGGTNQRTLTNGSGSNMEQAK